MIPISDFTHLSRAEKCELADRLLAAANVPYLIVDAVEVQDAFDDLDETVAWGLVDRLNNSILIDNFSSILYDDLHHMLYDEDYDRRKWDTEKDDE
jgi:hypothetical protein